MKLNVSFSRLLNFPSVFDHLQYWDQEQEKATHVERQLRPPCSHSLTAQPALGWDSKSVHGRQT